jgi:23S rRNA G2445 N2-methylase RlmL
METKEQREQRLELNQIMCDEITREMIKMIKRNANKAPTVSDKIRRLPIK